MAEARDRDLASLGAELNAWTLTPDGTEGWRKAEVTSGGVDTRELSSQTLQSQRLPGLHFIGEVVDVTGWLGGYNFQWAWASAAACARAWRRPEPPCRPAERGRLPRPGSRAIIARFAGKPCATIGPRAWKCESGPRTPRPRPAPSATTRPTGPNLYMTTIRVKENEPFDVALRRFKRTIEKLGLLTDLRAREFYEKPTAERKRKKAAAVKRHFKRVRSMQLPKKLF